MYIHFQFIFSSNYNTSLSESAKISSKCLNFVQWNFQRSLCKVYSNKSSDTMTKLWQYNMKQMRKDNRFHKMHYLNYTWQDKLIGLFLILIKHGWYSSMSFLKAFVWLAVYENDITLCLSTWNMPFPLNQVFIWNEIPCRWK